MNLILSSVKSNLGKIFLVTMLLVLPIMSFAQPTGTGGATICDPKSGVICNPISANSIPVFIKTLLEGILKIGIPLIAVAIIYSGFLFVAAQGNEEKLTKAKSAFMYTLIGTAILLGSWAIAKLISDTVLSIS